MANQTKSVTPIYAIASQRTSQRAKNAQRTGFKQLNKREANKGAKTATIAVGQVKQLESEAETIRDNRDKHQKKEKIC